MSLLLKNLLNRVNCLKPQKRGKFFVDGYLVIKYEHVGREEEEDISKKIFVYDL